MEPKSSPENWHTALSGIYEQITQHLISFLPHLMGAVFLLLIGWIVGITLARITLSLLSLINRLLIRLLPDSPARKHIEIKASHSKIAGKVVFWVVMLFFAAAAISVLGLDFFADWIREFLGYIPRLLAGLLIILGGYLIGNALNVMTTATAESAGFQRPHLAGSTVQLAVMFTAVAIGIEQLGINIQFITQLILVLIGVLAAGLSLAFGLGARVLISNVIGAQQIHKHCRISDQISIAGIEGTLVEVTNTMLVIESEHGRTMVPAKLYLSEISTVRNTVTKKANQPTNQ
ncbi:hypothetical protein BTA51_01045 [Hahella sp. CCB-MM4]|uniref:mechanosensitive ion channel family protein n=1 Tax=Hahella sp. (strain CCB-MM4) TaxID=1926491 RepID=UPI000B9C6B07|nr:mechanosensitive ion channel [Hahella sp. CCB-MM4]OZG75018.1 hypothetical protein BTA51_01045 [Hahella sp. CCB-MM4]